MFDYYQRMRITTLKALADETRLAIVELLADGERCVCDLATALGASDALVSHHIKRLREAGLVRTRRVGVWLHCSLEPQALSDVARTLDTLSARAQAAAESDVVCCSPSTRSRRNGREGTS